MNIRRCWRLLALLSSAVLILGFALPGSLAYIAVESNTLHNSFTPVYASPEETSVNVYLRKTVRNLGKEKIGPEGFQFELRNIESGESCLLTSNAKGYASQALHFTEADLGRVHSYTLHEINGGLDNVTYSDAVYDIQISLSVDAENKITAAASVNGKRVKKIAVEFENTYSAALPLPPTGDDARIPIYALLMITGMTGIVLLRKGGRRVRK